MDESTINTLLSGSRLIIGTILLAYASYTDIKTRRAANFLWVIMAGAGAVFLVVQYVTLGFPNIWYLVLIPAMIALFYLFYLMRLLFGGADAKALMALAILIPIQPVIGGFPLLSGSYIPWPGVWIVFVNSLIFFIFIPISLLIYNIGKRNLQFPHCMLGYQMTVEKAKQNFVWPLEKIKDGKKKIAKFPQDFDIDKELEEFEKLGIKEIWVTPKLPFMIPLFIGFLATFILGDILSNIISFLSHIISSFI